MVMGKSTRHVGNNSCFQGGEKVKELMKMRGNSVKSADPPLVEVEIYVLQIDPLHEIRWELHARIMALLRDLRLHIPVPTDIEEVISSIHQQPLNMRI